jgi:hypothetical protein
MFITFNQNNSGGYFIQNEDVDEFVIIEGNSLNEILEKASDVFDNYGEFCPCCGQRWYDYCKDENDMTEDPLIYGESAFDFHDGYDRDSKAIIYKLNGEKIILDTNHK